MLNDDCYCDEIQCVVINFCLHTLFCVIYNTLGDYCFLAVLMFCRVEELFPLYDIWYFGFFASIKEEGVK